MAVGPTRTGAIGCGGVPLLFVKVIEEPNQLRSCVQGRLTTAVRTSSFGPWMGFMMPKEHWVPFFSYQHCSSAA